MSGRTYEKLATGSTLKLAMEEAMGGALVCAAQAAGAPSAFLLAVIGLVALVALVFLIVFMRYFNLWLQALLSDAYMSFSSLVQMRLKGINPKAIVYARIMSVKAGMPIEADVLETHHLAGGNVLNVIRALIAAHKANVHLTFKKATELDIVGWDVCELVRSSINPKVLPCPYPSTGRAAIDAAAMDRVQVQARALVTVRANLDRFGGGVGEETVIARVEHGIADAIAAAPECNEVLEDPGAIVENVMAMSLDDDADWEILTIEILVDRNP